MNQMRPGQKNRNQRNKSGRKPMGNVVNRVYESAGPEGKVRGTPQQIIEKYLLLARDAQTSGDRVMAENFLQHAEHYIRLLGASQPANGEQRFQGDNRQLQGRADYEDRDEDEGDDEPMSSEMQRFAPHQPPHQPQSQPRQDQQPRQDREPRQDQQPREGREFRQDREPRADRPDRDPRDQQPRRDRERGGYDRGPRQPYEQQPRAPEPARSSPLDTIDPSDDLDLGLVATPEGNPFPAMTAPVAPAREATEAASVSAVEAAVAAPQMKAADVADPAAGDAPAAAAAPAPETEAPPPAPRRRGRPKRAVAAEGAPPETAPAAAEGAAD
jgi:hypothetical protein